MGVNPLQQNKQGKTVVDYSEDLNKTDMVQFFKQYVNSEKFLSSETHEKHSKTKIEKNITDSITIADEKLPESKLLCFSESCSPNSFKLITITKPQ